MTKPRNTKYCIVPKCINTTTKAPQKLFFTVPKSAQIRKKWLKIIKRVDLVGPNTVAHCCEDHFDIENDMENYVKYKLVGGLLKLKKEVMPHKFECQRQKAEKPERSAVQKRNRIKLYEKLLCKDNIPSTTNVREEVYVAFCEDENVVDVEDPLNLQNKEEL